MAKIGTAHIEVKPVVDEAALELIADRIAEAVAHGVEMGMAAANRRNMRPLEIRER